jgi:hypothetical protein
VKSSEELGGLVMIRSLLGRMRTGSEVVGACGEGHVLA